MDHAAEPRGENWHFLREAKDFYLCQNFFGDVALVFSCDNTPSENITLLNIFH